MNAIDTLQIFHTTLVICNKLLQETKGMAWTGLVPQSLLKCKTRSVAKADHLKHDGVEAATKAKADKTSIKKKH